MRLKTIISLLLLISGVNIAGAAVSASSFMKEAAEKITSSKSVSATFKIESAGQPTVTGNIAVQGDKFAINSSVSSTIYDGTTQWTISDSDKEISIFEPTDEEIAQVNPFAVIKAYNRDYKLKLISSDKNNVKIQLTPKANSSIKNIVVTFAATTKTVQQMTLTLDDGTVLHIKVSDITSNANIPASKFVVNLKNYNGYEIIDLR